jgi:hypothetical protein
MASASTQLVHATALCGCGREFTQRGSGAGETPLLLRDQVVSELINHAGADHQGDGIPARPALVYTITAETVEFAPGPLP